MSLLNIVICHHRIIFFLRVYLNAFFYQIISDSFNAVLILFRYHFDSDKISLFLIGTVILTLIQLQCAWLRAVVVFNSADYKLAGVVLTRPESLFGSTPRRARSQFLPPDPHPVWGRPHVSQPWLVRFFVWCFDWLTWFLCFAWCIRFHKN